MNPQHITSLEMSQKLKEAGWIKDTPFWWVHNKPRDEDKLCYGLTQCFKDHPESWEYYPAPLATELLEELPAKISDKTWLAYFKSENGYGGICEKVGYYEWERLLDGSVIHKKIIEFSACCKDPIDKIQYFSLPDALAKLWIYLKKENDG